MRLTTILVCALSIQALCVRADAQLYGSTAAGGPGELYILDSSTGGVLQDIGALNDASGQNYGITGLAFDPMTGVLFGSVSNSDAAVAAQLVTVDPSTALVTVIGAFNAGNPGTRAATMADIDFDPTSGGLYGIGSVGGPQLYSINTGTGQATITGPTGLTSTTGGGVAIDAAGNVYGTPTSSRYGTYDKVTGAFALVANPTKFVGGAYAAMAFNDVGMLYGLNLGTGNATHLVTFDPTTGAATDIGPSVVNLDAIAFRPKAGAIPEPGTMALLLGPGLIGALKAMRRRK